MILANPTTETRRFEVACKDAEKYAIRWNYDTAVFKNCEGQFHIREVKFLGKRPGDFNYVEQLYVAVVDLVRLTSKTRSATKKLNYNHGKTR